MKLFKYTFVLACALVLSACSKGPGKLEGTWEMTGLIPITVIYRDGEEESMGIISKVSYKHEGNDVIVHYLSGMAEGNNIRVTMTGPDTATTSLGTLVRAK